MSRPMSKSASSEDNFEDCEEVCEEAIDAELEEMTKAAENLTVATDFSLLQMNIHFAKCLEESSELSMSSYIAGYQEVFKFLTLLGSVFGWVASDVKVKLELLQKYNTGPKKEHYQTIKGMILYEVENDCIKSKKKDDPSGSRTLLRLHRALEYVVHFLDKLEGMKDNENCGPVSRAAYEKTLAVHHPWVVQKAAKLAMNLLPTKNGLVLKVVDQDTPETRAKVVEDFVQAVKSMKQVYSATQIFYEEKDLLNIP